MSTLSHEGLESLLGSVGMKTPIPHFEGTDVLNNPLDISRCYLADILHGIVKGEAGSALGAIQLPATVDFFVGDLSIILPKLARELGVKVEELSQTILDEASRRLSSEELLFKLMLSV